MNSYDVVVVGGRVAGASTALLLARAGVRVAVVERASRGVDTVSTHGLMRAGVLQLSRWGLLDRIVAAGTPPITRTVFHYSDGDQVQVSIRPSPGVDALYAPRRTVLDRILVEAAEEAGAVVLHDTAVTSLLRGAGRAGARRRRAGRARLADRARGRGHGRGRRHPVGGRPADRRAHDPPGEYGERGALPLRPRTRRATATSGRTATAAGAGLLPTNDGATCVFVGTTPERMRRLRRSGREQAFATLLTAAAPALVDRVHDTVDWSPMRGWAGVPGHVRQSWGPGWALVGDAGYYKDPITTHGMSDGLRDAELLADAVLEVLAGAPEPIALAAYQDDPRSAVDAAVRRDRGGGALRLGLPARRGRCCAR